MACSSNLLICRHDNTPASGIDAGWRRLSCGCVHESPTPKADAISLLVQGSKVYELHQPTCDAVLYLVRQLANCRECLLQCFSHAKIIAKWSRLCREGRRSTHFGKSGTAKIW